MTLKSAPSVLVSAVNYFMALSPMDRLEDHSRLFAHKVHLDTKKKSFFFTNLRRSAEEEKFRLPNLSVILTKNFTICFISCRHHNFWFLFLSFLARFTLHEKIHFGSFFFRHVQSTYEKLWTRFFDVFDVLEKSKTHSKANRVCCFFCCSIISSTSISVSNKFALHLITDQTHF